ncbi:MAG: hypothetical protein Q9187_006464 [Circinaria calcarea]
MALRRVFSQDSDFKESMFARQIAVMKGQAWNVVETLKTPDHGPLELTRRTRVCVWDDVVEIPVAIPLRVPSAELRRRTDAGLGHTEEEEEMDISAANNSASTNDHDLIELSLSNPELPNPNRFDLSRNPSSSDLGQTYHKSGSPAVVDGATVKFSDDVFQAKGGLNGQALRPGPIRSKSRLSFEGHRRRNSVGNHRKTFSFSRRGSAPFLYDGDDLEGDLGYAAAEGMERSQRKVIIERLETVKSQNPVFTWC